MSIISVIKQSKKYLSQTKLGEVINQFESSRIPVALSAQQSYAPTVQLKRAYTVFTIDGFDPEGFGIELKPGKDFLIGKDTATANANTEGSYTNTNSVGTLTYTYDETTHGRLVLSITGNVLNTSDVYAIVIRDNSRYSYKLKPSEG